MSAKHKNFDHLYATEYSLNKDVRKVQEHLHAGGSIINVYNDMGFECNYAAQILKYLTYREWQHVYGKEMLEFEEWKNIGAPSEFKKPKG